jgi:hypothetical protein
MSVRLSHRFSAVLRQPPHTPAQDSISARVSNDLTRQHTTNQWGIVSSSERVTSQEPSESGTSDPSGRSMDALEQLELNESVSLSHGSTFPQLDTARQRKMFAGPTPHWYAHPPTPGFEFEELIVLLPAADEEDPYGESETETERIVSADDGFAERGGTIQMPIGACWRFTCHRSDSKQHHPFLKQLRRKK